MIWNLMSGLGRSAVASQPCLLGHITADKREIKDFPKSRQVGASFIHKTLSEMAVLRLKSK